MILRQVAVLESHGRRWARPPSLPRLDRERRQRTGPKGEPLYTPAVQFTSRARGDRFSGDVLATLEAAGIDAFDANEGGGRWPWSTTRSASRPRATACCRCTRKPAAALTHRAGGHGDRAG